MATSKSLIPLKRCVKFRDLGRQPRVLCFSRFRPKYQRAPRGLPGVFLQETVWRPPIWVADVKGDETSAESPYGVHFAELGPLDGFGFAGVVLYVLAYLLIALRRVTGNSIWYYTLNLIAAVFVMVSLTAKFNLSSALIQGFWIATSGIGIFMVVLRPSRGVEITVSTPHKPAMQLGENHDARGPVIIDEFQSDLDSICIAVEAGPHEDFHREIDLRKSRTGTGIDLWMDGVLIAHVRNAVDVSPEHVRLVPKEEHSRQGKVHWIAG